MKHFKIIDRILIKNRKPSNLFLKLIYDQTMSSHNKVQQHMMERHMDLRLTIMKFHVLPGSLYRASKQPLLGLRPSFMRLDRSSFAFSSTISSVGFPLNFNTAAVPPSTFLKPIMSCSGSGKLKKHVKFIFEHPIK